MDSKERDQRAKDGFGERGEILFKRDSGKVNEKGKLEPKARPRARYENEPQISVHAANPAKENKVTPGASRKGGQDKDDYDPDRSESPDRDLWQEKRKGN
jgi:hypothetical protein